MSKKILIVLAMICFSVASIQAADKCNVAILEFENNTNEAQYDYLKKALGPMFTTEIQNNAKVSIIERNRINDIIKELQLGDNKFFDKETAAKIGKLIGATHILTGSYCCITGQWRIDIRFVDVENGRIMFSGKEEGSQNRIMQMVSDLSFNIAQKLEPNKKITIVRSRLKTKKNNSEDLFLEALAKREKGDKEAWDDFVVKMVHEDPVFLGNCYLYGRGVKKNADEALKLFQDALKNNDKSALYLIGRCYAEGKNNPHEAIKWYLQAAKQGVLLAQYELGICYENGTGVEQNQQKAVRYYTLAQKLPEALYKLGIHYIEGNGVAKDVEKGLALLKRSHNNDYESASYKLADIYLKGEITTQNLTQVYRFSKKAAGKEKPWGMVNLGYYYLNNYVGQKYSEEGIKWLEKAANQDDSRAQYILAGCYEIGHGVRQSIPSAVKYWELSAQNGYAEAMYKLALCYENGYVKADKAKYLTWLKRAAGKKYMPAVNRLNLAYLKNYGTKENAEEALRYFRENAKAGNHVAQYWLGYCYENGIGVKKDEKEAFSWYEKSANKNNPCAQYRLGLCYDLGIGVETDSMEAEDWYAKSAKQKYPDAMYTLAKRKEVVPGAKSILEAFPIGSVAFREYKAKELQTYAPALTRIALGYIQDSTKGKSSYAVKAKSYLRLPLKQNYSEALFLMGVCCYSGMAVPENYTQAFNYYKMAAEQGQIDAMYFLGICYKYGEGTERNLDEANKWINAAAKKGYPDVEGKLPKAILKNYKLYRQVYRLFGEKNQHFIELFSNKESK